MMRQSEWAVKPTATYWFGDETRNPREIQVTAPQSPISLCVSINGTEERDWTDLENRAKFTEIVKSLEMDALGKKNSWVLLITKKMWATLGEDLHSFGFEIPELDRDRQIGHLTVFPGKSVGSHDDGQPPKRRVNFQRLTRNYVSEISEFGSIGSSGIIWQLWK